MRSVSSDIMRAMTMNYKEYTHTSTIRISMGTWNVNGGKHFRSIAFKHEHITDWLLDLPKLTLQSTPGDYMFVHLVVRQVVMMVRGI